MTRTCFVALLAAPLFGGCTGKLSAPSGPGGVVGIAKSSHEVAFTCSTKSEVPSTPLTRLSRRQYENSLHELVRAELPSHADTVWAELSAVLTALPPDTISKGTPFATMDQATSQQHVDTYFRVASALAQALTADETRVRELLACGAGEAENSCIEKYIGRFGRRAFRHPLSEEELTYLRGVYAVNGIDVAALRDVISVALNAPQFLYRVEFGDKPVDGQADTFALNPYEVVTRLAYHFWQGPPSDALLAAAEQGELDKPDGYQRLLDSVVEDPRTKESLRAFVREWLELDALRPLDALLGDPAYDAFVGEDAPSPELRDAMIDDVLESFVYHVERDDSFADWFGSPYSFATGEELAALYGVERWSGEGEPPRFPEGERAGLLTRAALLSTGTVHTRPIMKGVFVRERILCDHLSPPPANASNLPAELTSTMTTREVVETLTEQPRTSCSSCHTTMINPLGFATESYDSLGRLRVTQPLYSATGEVLDQRPVDASSIPRVWLDDPTPSAGAQDLSAMIVRSGKAEACFARQYIRFAYGRTEKEQVDGCALEAVRSALHDGQSLQQAIRAPALRPEFRQRSLGVVQ